MWHRAARWLRDGSFSVPDARECTVTLAEGTRIILGKASSGRLHKLGFRSGARLELGKGHADLSVVHRLLGRWQVLAGPFAVRVTGTKFAVDWAPGQGRFGVAVSEGEVSADGGPLRDRTVSAGHRLEVDTATGYVIDGDLGTGVLATTAHAASAEAALQTAAESDAAPTPAVRAEHKRGAPSSKIGVRNPPLVARLETGAPNPEIPAATPEPGSGDWTASSAADDGPAPAAPGPRHLTIGKNGELVGGATGPVLAVRGSGTRFTAPASSAANHLYLDDGFAMHAREDLRAHLRGRSILLAQVRWRHQLGRAHSMVPAQRPRSLGQPCKLAHGHGVPGQAQPLPAVRPSRGRSGRKSVLRWKLWIGTDGEALRLHPRLLDRWAKAARLHPDRLLRFASPVGRDLAHLQVLPVGHQPLLKLG